MSDDPPKDGGSTDELPTLPGPAPAGAPAPAPEAGSDDTSPTRPDAVSLEPVTQKKASGTVIIQDRARPPAQAADPMAATVPIGSTVSETLPGRDRPVRPQPTVVEPASASPPAPPRAEPSGVGANLVFAIAGGALAVGIAIGAVIYLTRKPDEAPIPDPTTRATSAANTAAATQAAPPKPNEPAPPPVTPPTAPTTAAPPGTTVHPTPTSSSSAPPPSSVGFPPGFPTGFPTSLPTAIPTGIPTNLVPTALPSAWLPK